VLRATPFTAFDSTRTTFLPLFYQHRVSDSPQLIFFV
jgi:hypothetical protein